jgi:5'-methylthioadenosine phosphorylase
MINENEKIDIAVIGGTGVYDAGLLQDSKYVKISTPYGAPSDRIVVGTYCGRKVAFLPRHGANHHLPPHKVPYRANIWALKQLGVTRILAPSAVGSLRKGIPPGDIVITDQFIDFTKGRDYTFYDGGQVYHTPVANPFCEELRQIAISTAKELKIRFHDKGTNICIQGPRYSTKAESIYFKDVVKADTIGMTLVPECVLARELEICYLSIAASTDYDSWNDEPVNATMVSAVMAENVKVIRTLLAKIIPQISSIREKCGCGSVLCNAGH